MLFSVGCFNPDVKPGFCQKKVRNYQWREENKTKQKQKPCSNLQSEEGIPTGRLSKIPWCGRGCRGWGMLWVPAAAQGRDRAQTEPVAGTDTLDIPAGRSSSQRNKK